LVAAARDEGREDWLSGVPGTVARFAAEWSLSVDPPFQPGGQTAWVAPAHDGSGTELVLKVAWRHPEADHEAEGLHVWAGRGAVRLHEVAEFDDTIVLLLERCRPGSALSGEPEAVQDEVITTLLRRLWVDAPGQSRLRPLSVMCEQWGAQFDASRAAGRVSLDAGLAEHGIALFRSLPTTADRQVMLCTDLHAGNVLAAEREPWLMIDPKPYVGDPTYDVLQHMLNCPKRLHDDPLGLIAGLADLLDLDRERLRLWMFARCVQEAPDWPSLADVARRLAPS
jgi:streptomycin 6-kinase